jgi:hypothetical protein
MKITTAKELAFKAYCDALIVADPRFKEDWGDTQEDYETTIKESFEKWWSIHYWNNDPYKDHFNSRHIVHIDGKKYIQAE